MKVKEQIKEKIQNILWDLESNRYPDGKPINGMEALDNIMELVNELLDNIKK